MIYTITLDEMEFKAYHGCYDLEKLVGNRFLVSISLDAELDEAAHADDVTKTINYLRVYAIVAECMKQKSDILENVTLRIIEALYAEFPLLRHVRATVSKLAPPLGGQNTQGFRNTLPIRTLQIVNRLLITKRQEAGRSGKLDLNLHLAATDRPSQ